MPGQNILVAVVEIKVVALIKMEAKLLSILCVISCSKCEDTYFFLFYPPNNSMKQDLSLSPFYRQ